MHYWVQSFKEKARISMKANPRMTVALDETVLKVNGRRFYLYAALGVERKELVWMRVYAARNYLTTMDFVRNVLKYCKGKPVFITNEGP